MVKTTVFLLKKFLKNIDFYSGMYYNKLKSADFGIADLCGGIKKVTERFFTAKLITEKRL